ncbi:ribonuclease T [Rhodopseudomonas palustris]|uniref:Ribonuclease T n=1 Tax=Rhodopseudomonas palustris TaxID=1076 RepID=A0A323UB79_RHOPL|nr:ribonuclease T2 [Rhodopseudomonas palustris]PZA09483.1 ribonuclease T [Rhodopseudomonas palustris]
MLGFVRRRRSLIAACAAISALLVAPAAAQDHRQNAPGEFDFYVLALSWSPSYCAQASERGLTGRSQQLQCGGRPFAFVVHGLWPQYERGFPEYCERSAPRLDRRIVDSMLDLMPAPGLIYNEWDKHGTCAGLSQRGYFEQIRKARAAVRVPPEFIDAKEPRTVTPDEVEEAFIKVNPGLSNAAIAVMCDRKRLSEVRICMSKDLQFRACKEVDRRACRRDRLEVPPQRGG